MTLELRSGRYISPKIRTIDRFIVKEGQVLFPCVGQRYGIYGRPVLANRHLIGKAVSQAVMRLVPEEVDDAGYVSIYLSTGFGHRLSMRFSAGTSIPALSEEGAAKTLIYWPEKKRRRELSRIAERAWENRAKATELEDQARALVERTIEESGR
jgi:type I restriction enzyme, S subunit